VHLVFDRSFLPGDSAIMVPHTADGRVMFAIPWNGHTLVGTTDTPIAATSLEPLPLSEEIDFILETAGQYLHKPPTRHDVLSVFVGIRPLVSSAGAGNTAVISRDHAIRIDDSGLLSIAGGKWTTYRKMAEDCINQAATLAQLPQTPSATLHLHIHGFHQRSEKFENLAVYGSDSLEIQSLIRKDPSLGEPLHSALPYCGAEVVWATRVEMARTVEDVLARRTRALFLNARAASEMAPGVAAIMARELRQDAEWQAHQVNGFQKLAENYILA
jgi:glycerol-3-phosphate dehydrogenase